MKERIFLFLFLLSLGAAKAQNARLELGQYGGISFPMGTYATNDLDNGAFTTVGGTAGFYLSGRILKNLGLRAEAGYTLHPVDVVSLADAKVAYDPYLLSLIIRSEPYRWISAATGPEYHLSLNDRFSFTVYGMAGIMWGKTPYQLYKTSFYMYGPDYYEITSSRDKGLLFSSGISFQVRVTDYIRLSVGSSITYSHMQFGFYGYTGYFEDEINALFTNIQGGLIIPIL